jgi:hypothetical protein
MSTESTASAKSSLDDKIMSQYKSLCALRKKLEKIEKPLWLTDGYFKFSNSPSSMMEIKKVSELEVISMARFLVKESESHIKACEILNVKTNFKWFNYSFDEWVSDLKTRMSILKKSETISKINEAEKKLYKVLTPEQRRELESLDVFEILNGIEGLDLENLEV